MSTIKTGDDVDIFYKDWPKSQPAAPSRAVLVSAVPPLMPKTGSGYPHGMLTTHADVVNPDLLAVVKG